MLQLLAGMVHGKKFQYTLASVGPFLSLGTELHDFSKKVRESGSWLNKKSYSFVFFEQ